MRLSGYKVVPTILFRVTGALFIALAPMLCQAQAMRVTLLGTGAPDPVIERFGPSTLVEAGSEKLVFDGGRGASQRLWQLKIPLGEVNALFLTHLHSDHVVGIPDLWLTSLLPTPFGRRGTPLQVYGPQGTEEMMSSLRRAFQWDIRVRAEGPGHPSEAAIAVVAKDIVQGVAYERNGVKVTAFDVDHGPLMKPAFGYRVDYAGRSVVISGDTRFSENLIRFARGADVVVHEVMAARPELLSKSEAARGIVAHHTQPEEAGRVFDSVKPKLAVYSHVSLVTTDPSITPPTTEELIPRTRTTYGGPLEVGEDLMTIVIDDRVEVRRIAPLCANNR